MIGDAAPIMQEVSKIAAIWTVEGALLVGILTCSPVSDVVAITLVTTLVVSVVISLFHWTGFTWHTGIRT